MLSHKSGKPLGIVGIASNYVGASVGTAASVGRKVAGFGVRQMASVGDLLVRPTAGGAPVVPAEKETEPQERPGRPPIQNKPAQARPQGKGPAPPAAAAKPPPKGPAPEKTPHRKTKKRRPGLAGAAGRKKRAKEAGIKGKMEKARKPGRSPIRRKAAQVQARKKRTPVAGKRKGGQAGTSRKTGKAKSPGRSPHHPTPRRRRDKR